MLPACKVVFMWQTPHAPPLIIYLLLCVSVCVCLPWLVVSASLILICIAWADNVAINQPASRHANCQSTARTPRTLGQLPHTHTHTPAQLPLLLPLLSSGATAIWERHLHRCLVSLKVPLCLPVALFANLRVASWPTVQVLVRVLFDFLCPSACILRFAKLWIVMKMKMKMCLPQLFFRPLNYFYFLLSLFGIFSAGCAAHFCAIFIALFFAAEKCSIWLFT